MSFFPEGYKEETNNSYFKIKNSGDYKVRVLSTAIFGYVDWLNNKPVRTKDKPRKNFDDKNPAKKFMTFIVWDYADEKIKVWEITQVTIRQGLKKIYDDPDWGAPYFYDIRISRTASEGVTRYAVTPLPAKPLPMAIRKAFEESPCCLEALFDGGHPFEPHPDREPTPGVFSQDDLKKPSVFTDNRLQELKEKILADDLPAEYLAEYADLKAKEKKVSTEDVITSALTKEVLPRFLKTYRKWLEDSNKLEEAIPF